MYHARFNYHTVPEGNHCSLFAQVLSGNNVVVEYEIVQGEDERENESYALDVATVAAVAIERKVIPLKLGHVTDKEDLWDKIRTHWYRRLID